VKVRSFGAIDGSCVSPKRQYETIQFYLIGWVTDEEFETHLSKLDKSSKKPG
jgi:hypothetical protein